MKNLKLFALTAVSTTLLFTSVQSSAAAMDSYMETALISVCKVAQKDNVLALRKTIKGYRLKDQTVAMKVVCNGEHIINFAENSNSFKTAAHLSKRLGESKIVDLAQAYAVNY